MEPTQANNINKRILVLGSDLYIRLVTAYTWDNLPSDLNVADYDVVILNLIPLLDEELTEKLTCGLNPKVLPSWEQFARLLFSHSSEIIIIGVPQTPPNFRQYEYFFEWLPLKPKFIYNSGEQIHDIDPEFAFYFQQVRRWTFHAADDLKKEPFILENFLRIVNPQANFLGIRIVPIARTRFQKPIAFKLQFQAVQVREQYPLDSESKNLQESGYVIWLPPPTEISDHDAISIILQKRYGLQLEQTPPNWIKDYKLPQQIPIEEKIFHYEQEIKHLEKELAITQKYLQNALRFRKLLYEQGVEGLEPIVREALRELGAAVQDPPPQENREDGRLTAPHGQIGMLEIKGRTKSLALTDIRQLDQWVRDALIQENLESKGILIANMYCNRPPNLRENPFPSNCINSAKITKLCLMTTTQLFHALCSYQRKELDIAEFWNTVFNTNGVCPLPEV